MHEHSKEIKTQSLSQLSNLNERLTILGPEFLDCSPIRFPSGNFCSWVGHVSHHPQQICSLLVPVLAAWGLANQKKKRNSRYTWRDPKICPWSLDNSSLTSYC